MSQIKVVRKLDIPADKIQEYRDTFNSFDKDGSGTISVEEIARAMKNIGNEMSEEEVREMVKDLDQDGSGEIDFEEFTTLMHRTEEPAQEETVPEEAIQEEPAQEEFTEQEDEVIRAFKSFDRDDSGTLSMSEFKDILTSFDDKLNDYEIENIFKQADLDHDGQLNYREFVKFWKNIS